MIPDTRLIIRYRLPDVEYPAENSGIDTGIDSLILISRGWRIIMSVTPYFGTITDEQANVNQSRGKKCPTS